MENHLEIEKGDIIYILHLKNQRIRIPIEHIAYQDICLGFSQPIKEAAGFVWATGLLEGTCLAVRACFGSYFFKIGLFVSVLGRV